MKKQLAVLAVMLAMGALLTHPVQAQSDSEKAPVLAIDNLRVATSAGHVDRFLGNENLGAYWERKFGVVMESQHQILINFLLRSYDYGRVDLSGLEANARIAELGLTVPFGRRFSIRTVYDAWVDEKASTIDAGGAYLNWKPNDQWWVEFAIEQFFSKAPELYNLTADYTVPEHWPVVSHVFSGVSSQYVQNDYEPHHSEDRIMVGSLIPVGSWRFGWGVSTRIDSLSWSQDVRAWNVSVALPVSYEDTRPWAPGMYVNYREKPGSKYLMALGSCGGYALNPHVISALLRSNYRALNTPTRVVNNQNFNISVLNSNPQEFGRISGSFIWFNFDVTDELSSQSVQGSVYYTHTPWHTGKLAYPFIGYTYGNSEDITYSVSRHRLESVGHVRHSIDVGGRLRWRKVAGSDADKGYLRIDVTTLIGSDGYEGGAIELTTWL